MAGYFGKNVLRRKSGVIKFNENCRKRHNKVLMQLFGDLDVLSLVRIYRLYWSGHVNRMDSESSI